MKKWKVVLGEPQVVFHSGKPYRELGWGPYQFTQLRRTTKGEILYSWELGNDKIEDYAELDDHSTALSEDGGEHWSVPAPAEAIPIYEQARLSDGRYFAGFELEEPGIDVTDWIDNYEDKKIPVEGKSIYGELFGELYYANEIKEFPMACTTIKIDPMTEKKEKIRSKIIWNYAPMLVYPSKGRKYAATYGRIFAIQSRAVIERNGALFFCTYVSGVDPITGEITQYSHMDSVYVFRSDDDGATWVAQSYVQINDKVFEYVHRTHGDHIKDFEGFSEPRMGFLPDGGLAMILRTGSKMPSYIVYSHDEGKSWTEPILFDKIGVFPSILTLGCGVTVASYGRLGVFLRMTDDPSAKEWDDPIEIPLTIDRIDKKFRSCSYTSLLPIDDTSFLLSYSDFHYPNKQGEQTKALLVRKVTLLPKK